MIINIIPMNQEHLDRVVEIETNSFPTPWSKNAFKYEINSNDFAYYVVAETSGDVVGYAGMWIVLDEVHITTIAVHPLYRKSGIGEKLLNHLLDQGRRYGCTKSTLEVRPSNVSALSLYQKVGFISYGVRRGYYTDTGEDAVIMWRDL